MDVLKRYSEIRPQIGDGCIGLISKNAFVSKSIRWFDSAEYSHSFTIYEKQLGEEKCLFVLEADGKRAAPALLSDKIKGCDKFLIIKPLCSKDIINIALYDTIRNVEDGTRYDFFNGFKEALNRKFNLNFKITGEKGLDICSKLTAEQFITQNMCTDKFKDLVLPFPQDYLRYLNTNNTLLL